MSIIYLWTGPCPSLKTKKIQVDPESHDHAFEEFKVENEFKDDQEFEEFEDESEFNDDHAFGQ